MSGQTMNYKKYNAYVKTMQAPVMPSELPHEKIDFKGLIAYAKSKGVSVPELSQIEKRKYITNYSKSDA